MSSASATSASTSAAKPLALEPSYCFVVEWFDAAASLVRKYHLFFFLNDNTIEMYDLKNRRTFLKRCSYPSISLTDLYLGGQVTVYARQLKIVAYGDEVTRSKLEVAKSRCLAVIKSSGVAQLGNILTALYKHHLHLGRLKMLQLTPVQAQHFYGDATVTPRAYDLASGPVVALEVIGEGAHEHLTALIAGSALSSTAARSVHVASSERSAEAELSFFFANPQLVSSATLTDCTCAVIKPHAVAAGYAGPIVCAIQDAGFVITAIELFHLDAQEAEEFVEVYKGVVPEYHGLVEQFSSGPLIALEIRKPGLSSKTSLRGEEKESSAIAGSDIVSAFRALVGPSDTEIARQLRPNTLRAKWGENKIRNAIHCTDLPEDGLLECEFFFSVLQPKATAS